MLLARPYGVHANSWPLSEFLGHLESLRGPTVPTPGHAHAELLVLLHRDVAVSVDVLDHGRLDS
eukprot:4102016-Alexandrium_andersonii.AAC.1